LSLFAKEINTQKKYCQKDLTECQSTTTLTTLANNDLSLTEYICQTLFALEYLANHSQLQEKEQEKMMIDTFGLSSKTLLLTLDQNTSYWKTLKDCCQSVLWTESKEECSDKYSQTFPKSGIVVHGLLMALPMLAHHTKGRGYSFWATTNTMDYLPQRSQEAMQRQFETSRKGRTKPGNLREHVDARMWPTPRAREGNSGAYGTETCKKHADKHYLDGTVLMQEKKQGQLNADWVECLMNYPIGWTSQDEPQEWPGWPAPLNGDMWGTHTATSGNRSASFDRPGTSPKEFVAKGMTAGQYDYEPPRVTTGQKDRAKRLKALGNAVVPLQIKPIFDAIVQLERRNTHV